jgi:hypothetical protein
MSKGQQAMAVAMMYPEPAKTKRKRSGSLEPKELGISGARIYSAASAGVSLTFINLARSMVLGYDLDLGHRRNLIFDGFFFKKTLVDRGPACGRRNGFTYRGRWRGAAVNFLVVYAP